MKKRGGAKSGGDRKSGKPERPKESKGPKEPKNAKAANEPTKPAEQAEWVVVCVGCRRIKRHGVWTDEKAAVRAGQSTGFCDVCAAKRRDELRLDRK